jgi:hypothetical protein
VGAGVARLARRSAGAAMDGARTNDWMDGVGRAEDAERRPNRGRTR